jgi:hypothetical protein
VLVLRNFEVYESTKYDRFTGISPILCFAQVLVTRSSLFVNISTRVYKSAKKETTLVELILSLFVREAVEKGSQLV